MTDNLENFVAVIRGGLAKIELAGNLNRQGIFEAGNGLVQSKKVIPRGQWQSWLAENFNLSPATARKYMQVARRFGDKMRIDTRFDSTKLIAMLSLPPGDEQKFIEICAAAGKSVESMTVKKLRSEIAEWKGKAESAVADNSRLAAENSALKRKFDELEKMLQFNPLARLELLKTQAEFLLAADDRDRFVGELAQADIARAVVLNNNLIYLSKVFGSKIFTKRRAQDSRQLVLQFEWAES